MQNPAYVLLFVDVIKEGSIAAAARKHQITRATASRRLKTLEQSIGTQLLHRTNQHTRLTQAGEIYYKHACTIHETIQQAEAAVRELSNQPAGLLNIAIPVINTERFLMPAFWGFLGKYPKIQVKVLVETDIRNIIAKGIDIAFQIGFEHNPTLRMRKLLPIQIVAIASPSYIEAHGMPNSLDAIHEHNILSLVGPDGSIPPWRIKNKDEFHLQRTLLCTNSSELLLKSALDSRGITALPALLVEEELRKNQLIQILPEQLHWTESFSIVHADTNIVQPKVRAFIDYMVEFVEAYLSQQAQSSENNTTLPSSPTKTT